MRRNPGFLPLSYPSLQGGHSTSLCLSTAHSSLKGLYSAVHSVTVYRFEDLQKATNDFSSDYRVILEKDEEREKDVLLSTVVVPLLESEDAREKLRSLMDPNLGKDYPLDLALTMAQQAKTCLSQDLGT
ncbi:hypothetical protein AMTR_s00129p00077890 [Amborella trichopoda]|uniref:Uncharacterized protein n=1 Tax=Amborella trichopoda TaxID=13333 RepID=W1NLD2_AMBTC|nr:hypothetical protein AMTR_s00129p00077890 [Amborella trichopoda]